jgi:phage terminase small subunit
MMGKRRLDKDTGLTEQQKLFYQEYLIDMDITNAVFRAGYKASTANSACAIGCKLLKDPIGKKYLDILLIERAKMVDITVGEIVAGIKAIINDPSTKASVRLQAYKTLGEYKQMFKKDAPTVVINNNRVDSMSISDIETELELLEKIDE